MRVVLGDFDGNGYSRYIYHIMSDAVAGESLIARII
jgi:hypothetical protein